MEVLFHYLNIRDKLVRRIVFSEHLVDMDRDRQVDLQIAKAIVSIAPDSDAAVSAHLCLVRHGDAVQRFLACRRLGQLQCDAARCGRALLEVLTDPNPYVVREALTALGMIGPAAKEAIPALEKLTNHEDKQIAERAKAALKQIREK